MSVNVDSRSWRLRAGAIPYKLMDPSPTGSVNESSATIEEKYIIRAANLPAFLALSFPLGIALDEENIALTPNRRYPGSNAYVTSSVTYAPLEEGLPCDPYGIDPYAPAETYCENLIVTITYVTGKQTEDEEDPTSILEISADAAGEFIMHSAQGKCTWGAAGGNPVQGTQVPVSKFVPETQWAVRWPSINREFVPRIMTAMRNRLGKINSSDMPLLMGAKKTTVLFVGYSYSEQYTWREGIENAPAVIDMKFLEKHIEQDDNVIGHNHFFREDTGKFELLFLPPPGGGNVYAEADLNNLFPPTITAED